MIDDAPKRLNSLFKQAYSMSSMVPPNFLAPLYEEALRLQEQERIKEQFDKDIEEL